MSSAVDAMAESRELQSISRMLCRRINTATSSEDPHHHRPMTGLSATHLLHRALPLLGGDFDVAPPGLEVQAGLTRLPRLEVHHEQHVPLARQAQRLTDQLFVRRCRELGASLLSLFPLVADLDRSFTPTTCSGKSGKSSCIGSG
jgi:hypothetical protein